MVWWPARRHSHASPSHDQQYLEAGDVRQIRYEKMRREERMVYNAEREHKTVRGGREGGVGVVKTLHTCVSTHREMNAIQRVRGTINAHAHTHHSSIYLTPQSTHILLCVCVVVVGICGWKRMR
jgi:hypothetical protein